MAEFTSLIQPDSTCSVLGGGLELARKEFWTPPAAVRLQRHFQTPRLGLRLNALSSRVYLCAFWEGNLREDNEKNECADAVWQAKRIRIKAFMYFLYSKSDIFATKP
jgi:hypothetical protein